MELDTEKHKFRVAIVGATGLVGSEILSILDEKGFPCDEILAFASEESRGTRLQWRGEPDALRVDIVNAAALETCDLIFSAAPEGVTKRHLQPFGARRGVVIDCSSSARFHDGVPLIVAGVNTSELDENVRYIATPGAIAALVAPVVDAIRRLTVPVSIFGTVFVSASHQGRAGMDELSAQTVGLLNQTEYPTTVFSERLAFNVHGRVGGTLKGGGGSELELQAVKELRTVLDEPELEIDILAAQIPVFSGISAHISVVGSKSITKENLVAELDTCPGFWLTSDEERPTLDQVGQRDDIQVSRLRVSPDGKRIGMWIATDNLRRGSALNAVKIAEHLVSDGLIPTLKDRVRPEKFRTVRLA
ncbi:MAG: hypothetical protein HUU55_15085 [Myxococcales bacterium]|nr:hypothetical protein [Myxococcales bacterium]